MYKSIALVDAGYLIVRNFKAKASDVKLTPAQVAEYTVANVMTELAATRDAVEHVILCCDAPPYWRKAEFADYKATRSEPDPELAVIKRAIFERIKLDGYTIARVDSFEADDVIATLAKEYAKACPDVRIVGADKDAMQCVNDRVRVFVPKVNKRPEEIMGPAEVRKKFGVLPEAMALYQALVGDTGDNIPGVEKVGAKTAAEWINTYGSNLTKLGVQLAEQSDKGDKMPATWRNFGEAWPKMKLWLRMTTLRTDVPVDAAALLVKQQVEPLVAVDQVDETDPDLDAIDAQFAADFPPPADEDLAEERQIMAAGDVADLISGPPAKEPWDTPEHWERQNAKHLSNGYAQEQIDSFTENPRAKAWRAEQLTAHAANQCHLHEDCAHHDAAARELGKRAGMPKMAAEGAIHKHEKPGDELWRKGAEEHAARERQVAKTNVTPANGKAPTEAEIDASVKDIAERNAKERARAAQVLADTAKEFAAGEAARKTKGAAAPVTDAAEVPQPAAKAPAAAPVGKVTEAEFTEPAKQPAPKAPKPTAEERLMSGEFDAKAQTTALARVPQTPQEFSMALQPRTASEAIAIAKHLYNSRRYGQHGSDAGIFAMICTGRELGLTMMQTLNGFHIVKDKPFAGWQLIKSLAERHPDCEWLVCSHSDEKSATWRTKHRIHGILEYTYTYERALKAGVVAQNRQAWEGKPTEMVCKTSLSKSCWLWYTGALIGLPLSDEVDTATEEQSHAAE